MSDTIPPTGVPVPPPAPPAPATPAAAPAARPTADRSREMAVLIARTAEEMKCKDVVVLELGSRSQVADFFVLATGTSFRQIRSAADEVIDRVQAEFGSKPIGREGYDQTRGVIGDQALAWVLLDYVNVVVHLFDTPARAFYDLEMLWGDAPKVEWKSEG
jgi:ribosome-associated protein